jgi:hypothetical protein
MPDQYIPRREVLKDAAALIDRVQVVEKKAERAATCPKCR